MMNLSFLLFEILFAISASQHVWAKTSGVGYGFEFVEEPMNFSAAEQVCQTFGGHLVTIRLEKENVALDEFRNASDTWIGMKAEPNKAFEWVDKSETSFTNWKKVDSESPQSESLSPEIESTAERCVHMDVDVHGTKIAKNADAGGEAGSYGVLPLGALPPQAVWTVSNCSVLKPFVCKTPWIFVSKALNFSAAEKFCQSDVYYGHLAQIDSEEENDQVKAVRGAHDISTEVWIGLKSANEAKDSFVWTTGSGLLVEMWEQQKDNAGGAGIGVGECVKMSGAPPSGPSGLWSFDECNTEKSFVCRTGQTDMFAWWIVLSVASAVMFVASIVIGLRYYSKSS